jgi:transposase
LDGNGELILERKIKNDPHELDKFFDKFDKEDSHIALESCSCWEYVFDYLTDMGFTKVVLANPSRVRLIATSKKKTDRYDAKVLADLLRTNLLPTSYAPSTVIREQRLITRHRASLGRVKSTIKNKIHAILIRNGINQEFSDVFGVEGIKYLMSLDLSDIDRYQMDQYLSLIRHLDLQSKKTESRIEEYSNYTPQVAILRSMPGISFYSGLTIAGEIGDVRRFSNARKLVAFAGLNPSVSQSGDRCYTGHIAKLCEEEIRTYFISSAEKIVSENEIIHFDLNSKTERVTTGFLPDKYPVEILITSGASCPDAVVESVIRRIASLFENVKDVDAVVNEILEQV